MNTPRATYTVYALVETRVSSRYHGVVRYVGQTKNFTSRMQSYRRGRGNNPKHTNWLKACPDFEIRVLREHHTLADALAIEIMLIAQLNTYRSPHGLNMHPGGGYTNEGPQKLSHSQAISLALTGRTFSAEHCQRISSAKKGITISLEHRDKTSKALKGRPHSLDHNQKVAQSLRLNSEVVAHLRNLAKNKTPEHRAKLASVAASKRWQCNECSLRSNAGGVGTHQKGSGHEGRHLVISD